MISHLDTRANEDFDLDYQENNYLGGEFVNVLGILGSSHQSKLAVEQLHVAHVQSHEDLDEALIDLDSLIELEVQSVTRGTGSCSTKPFERWR